MTSMAVTASMCASASEVALLVASFMPVLSPNLGATYRGADCAHNRQNFSLGTPRDAYSPVLKSPRGEYRLCQRRTVLRRQFDSKASADGYCLGKIIA